MSKKNNKNLADKVRDINEKEEMKEESFDTTADPRAKETTVDLSSVSIITAENGPENFKVETPEEIKIDFEAEKVDTPVVDEAAKKLVESREIDKEDISTPDNYEDLPEDVKPGDVTISDEAKYVVVVDYTGIDEKKRDAYQEKLDKANVDYVVNADGTFMAGPYEVERDAILIKKRIESRGLKCKVFLYDDFIKAE